MYFSTFDPYDEKYDIFLTSVIQREENHIDESSECIICWEHSTSLNQIYPLDYTSIIHKTCKCNVSIHDKCLRIWIKTNKTCPICRTEVRCLDMTFSESSEQMVQNCGVFLGEYKNIFYIIFAYLIFLQISIFYMLVINDKINEDFYLDTVL